MKYIDVVGSQWHETTSELMPPVRFRGEVQSVMDRPQLHRCGVSIVNVSPKWTEVAFVGVPDLVGDFTEGAEMQRRDLVAESLDRGLEN